ncbi:hypothetical protein FI667_g1981, partial [Globisporangium splendens]
MEAKEPSWRQQLIDRMDAKIELSAQTTMAHVVAETEAQVDAKCGCVVAKRQLDDGLDVRKQKLNRVHDYLVKEAIDKLERKFEENDKRKMCQPDNCTINSVQEQLAKTTREWQEMQAKMVSRRQELLALSATEKIVLKIPGLYHLQAAFFTDFTPTIRILVNGHPVLVYSTGKDDSGLLATSDPKCEKGNTQNGRRPGPSVQRVHHSAGNIVGVAMDAFLALPARAVVQIAYYIYENAQGFLSLRKL